MAPEAHERKTCPCPSSTFVDGCLLFMSSHCLPVCVCIQVAPSYIHVKSHVGLVPTLRTSL